MTKAGQMCKDDLVTRNKTKDNCVQRRNEETDGISIEIKNYTLSELSGLQGKFKKIETALKVDEEKSNGKSIMVNMKTMVFEIFKIHIMDLLKKHPTVVSVIANRTARAATEDGNGADTEYHIDVEFAVEEKSHQVKMKVFNTNCRIQIQHMGRTNHSPQPHLKDRSPPKFFAEEILVPFCKSIDESISPEKEKEFIVHLRKEIQRLKKVNKTEINTNKSECVNEECKNSKHLNVNNIESYGTCWNCQGYEHYRCAKVDAPTKSSYQVGSVKYLCTECLKKNPLLAIQEGPQTPLAIEEDASNVAKNIIEDIIDITEQSQVKTQFKCRTCDVSTVTEAQLETHVRIKHTEIRKYFCNECEFATDLEHSLNEHVQSKHREIISCTICDYEARNQEELNIHELAAHRTTFKCNECDFSSDNNISLVTHKATHIKFKCYQCDYETNMKDLLATHIDTVHRLVVFVCVDCDLETSNKDELKDHIKNNHTKSTCDNRCENLNIIENNYKILKESYERLVTINKQLQSQQNDRAYALEIQNEELKNGFERMKKENIKFQDSLETQNKLWKIWLQKHEQSNIYEVVTKESNSNDDEILLIEDDEEVTNTENDDVEKIFQTYLKNSKQSGYRRTTPSQEAEKSAKSEFKCNDCGFKSETSQRLQEHVKNAHASSEKNRQNNKPKQFCHFWNNQGKCDFESKNGRPCKFLHEKAPKCKFDGHCNRKRCMFSHQQRPFLVTNPRRGQPQRQQNLSPYANQFMSHQMPWGIMMDQNQWGQHFPMWGNSRQF